MRKKIISLLMAIVTCFSVVVSGGLGFLSSPITAYAAEGEGDDGSTIEDGSYIVTLNSVSWNNGKVDTYRKSGTIKYSSRGLLEVKDGEVFVTMQLRNAKYVEYAWILDQNHNATYPKVSDKTGGLDLWTDSMGTDVSTKIQTLTGGSNWADTNSAKYLFTEESNSNYIGSEIIPGDSQKDTAYVTFKLTNYKEKFCTIFWSQVATTPGYTPGAEFRYFQIDESSIFSLNELNEWIERGKTSVQIDDAQLKNSTVISTSTDQEFASLLSGTANISSAENGNVSVTIPMAQTTLNHKGKVANSPIVSVNAHSGMNYPESGYVNFEAGAVYGTTLYNSDKAELAATFTENELIYGIDINVKTQNIIDNGGMEYFGTIVLTPSEIKDVTITDSGEDNTSVYVTGRNTVLPEDAILKIELDRAYTEYPETSTYTRDSIIEWGSNLYQNPKHWFYIQLTDKDGNELKTYDGITLHIPLETSDANDNPEEYSIFAFTDVDALLFDSSSNGAEAYGNVVAITNSDNSVSYEFQYVCSLGQRNIQGSTFGYMKPGDYANLYEMVKSGTDDGIYTARAQLQKEGKEGSSMANAALNPNVMITIHNGEIKIYFTSSYLTISGAQAYIGELFCYDVDGDKVWYEDSVIYTDYLTDANGYLVSNCGYDPIKYCGCVEGGIITLRDESYVSEKGCYNLAIVPPAMLGGADYSTLNKTELAVHLRVTDMVKVSDYSEENIDKYVLPNYHFDKSALRKEIDYAGLFSADEYTKESYNALTAAVTAAETVYAASYDDDVTASKAYEEQINLVKAAVANLEESTELTDAKEALQEAIDTANAVEIGDKTESAYAELQNAISAAENVLNNTASGVSDINAAKTALETAVTAFNNSEAASELNKNDLADGVYSVYVDMVKMDRISKSMADNAINHIVKLEVINGEYYITLDFKGITIENRFGYLKNLSYYADGYTYGEYGTVTGTLVPAEILSTQKDSDGNDVIDQYNDASNLYPDTVKIKLVSRAVADENGFVPLHVFVPIMEAIAEGNGDQDVLMKIDWSTLKATTEDDEDFQPEEPVEQSPAVDYTDADTGVKVNADKGVFEADTVIDVTEITSGNDYDKAAESLSDVGKKFKLYNVVFVDGDGDEVAPNGTIKLSIPVPNGYDTDDLFIYRINSDGTKTRVNGSAADGYFTVVTRNGGVYALVEAGSTDADTDNGGNQSDNSGNNNNTDVDNPQTGDTSNMALWFALMIASLGAMLVTLGSGFKRKRVRGE